MDSESATESSRTYVDQRRSDSAIDKATAFEMSLLELTSEACRVLERKRINTILSLILVDESSEEDSEFSNSDIDLESDSGNKNLIILLLKSVSL